MTTNENEIAVTAQVLLTPEMATGRVSRQEIVNLIVVEYIDHVKGQIAVHEAAMNGFQVACADAARAAYEAWRALILSRALPRLQPWRAAVQAALDGAELSELYSKSLPLPTECLYSALNGVTCPDRSHHQDERDPTILDLLQQWLDRSSGERPTYVGKVTFGALFRPCTVDLASFPMTWTFAGLNAKFSSDWHSLKISVDVRPDEAVVVALDALIDAYLTHQAAFQAMHKLKDEIEDKHVAQLERRALAKLTMQTMGEIPRPSLA